MITPKTWFTVGLVLLLQNSITLENLLYKILFLK
jgi:hypothetical protein